MNTPSVLEQLLYLGQVKSAPERYREWVAHIVTLRDSRRQGLLLAIPNAVIMAVVGIALVVVLGEGFGLVFLVFAPAALVAGASVHAISDRRLRKFAAKHGATSLLS